MVSAATLSLKRPVKDRSPSVPGQRQRLRTGAGGSWDSVPANYTNWGCGPVWAELAQFHSNLKSGFEASAVLFACGEVCMCVHACGGQRSTVGVIPQRSTLVFLRPGSLTDLVLVKQTRLSDQGAPGTCWSPFPQPAMLGSPVHSTIGYFQRLRGLDSGPHAHTASTSQAERQHPYL